MLFASSIKQSTEYIACARILIFLVLGLILIVCMLHSTNKKVNRKTKFMPASHNKLCIDKIFNHAKIGCWALPHGFILALQDAHFLKVRVSHFHILLLRFFLRIQFLLLVCYLMFHYEDS